MADSLMEKMAIEELEDGIQVRPVYPDIQEDGSQTETLPLQSFVGIDRANAQERTQLKEIWDYLAESANGVGDLLHQFRQIEARMSPPKLGETRLKKVYSYVKLQGQIKEAEKHRDSL